MAGSSIAQGDPESPAPGDGGLVLERGADLRERLLAAGEDLEPHDLPVAQLEDVSASWLISTPLPLPRPW